MKNGKFIYQCDLCGSEYQFGPHKYDGKYIRRYELNVCKSCYDGNWEGWGPHCEERLIAHLKQKNIPIPEKNAKGWLPRD